MKVAVFDTESDGLLPYATRIWCAAVKDLQTGETISFNPKTIDQFIDKLDEYDLIVGHNIIGHDIPVMRKVYGRVPKARPWDTLIVSRTQDPKRKTHPRCPKKNNPHSIEAWGFRVGRFKPQYDDWSRYTPEMLNRTIEDTEINALVYQYLLDEAEDGVWDTTHRINMKLAQVLQLQEERGWYVDEKHMYWCIHILEKWIRKIEEVVRPNLPILTICEEKKDDLSQLMWVKTPFKIDGDYQKRIYDYWGDNPPVAGPYSRVSFRPTDLDSPIELKNYLLSVGWIPLEWNTDSYGKRSTPKLSQDDPFNGITGKVGSLVARRQVCKQRLGTIRGWTKQVQENGRISPRVSGFAATGRLKHSVIVNVPGSEAFFGKYMRMIFRSSPGFTMVGVDSKGNQARQLAARMDDDEWTHAVLTGDKKLGTDEHSLTAKRCGLVDKDGTIQRHKAKTLNYSTIFGARDKKVASSMGVSLKEGAHMRTTLFKYLPKLAELIDRLTEEWKASAEHYWNSKYRRFEYRNGYITGLDGRRILVEKEHTVLVYLLQSDEAIQMAVAYLRFYDQMHKRGYIWDRDWAYLIWYHDEFQFETIPEIAEEAKDLACEAIAWSGRFFKIKCPHEGDGTIGHNWYETH